MKKKLLKLFNEAGFHQPEMERLGIEHKFERFAELIVRECADFVAAGEFGDSGTAKELKEHFGVEE